MPVPTASGRAPDPRDGPAVRSPGALLFTGKESDLSVDAAILGAVLLVTSPIESIPPNNVHSFHAVPSTVVPLVACSVKPNSDSC